MVTTRAGSWSARTARARRFRSPVREFLRTESGGAAVLLAATAPPLGSVAPRRRSRGGSSAAEGLGLAMSTDTAFAPALLTLFGPARSRPPAGVLTVAIADDLLAPAALQSASSRFSPPPNEPLQLIYHP